MIDFFIDFTLGALIKSVDEIADVPFFRDRFISYVIPMVLVSVFLYGLHAVNDFYYNLVWVAWFFSAYFGKSLDNEIDKGYWNLIFFMVLFALLYSFSYPLPKTHWPTLLTFLLILGTGNILDNIIMPEEVSIQKIAISVFVCVAIPFFYVYGISPIRVANPTADLRFVDKHVSLILGYLCVRFFSKVYLYSLDTANILP